MPPVQKVTEQNSAYMLIVASTILALFVWLPTSLIVMASNSSVSISWWTAFACAAFVGVSIGFVTANTLVLKPERTVEQAIRFVRKRFPGAIALCIIFGFGGVIFVPSWVIRSPDPEYATLYALFGLITGIGLGLLIPIFFLLSDPDTKKILLE